MPKSKLRYVDLFAGIGGCRIGFEQALHSLRVKGECVFSSEINPHAVSVYETNFGDTPQGDIRQVDALPEHDVLLAGFPCQSFSYAGKRAGFGDTRGTLFFEIERLIRGQKNKPRFLILENVRGFTTHDGGRTYATVLNCIERLGYSAKGVLLNSSDFGVPQNRVRVYIVATLKNDINFDIKSNVGFSDTHKAKQSNRQKSFFDNTKQIQTYVKDILESSVSTRYNCSETFTNQLKTALDGKPIETLHGMRLIDYRGGNSLHSWDLGTKGVCTQDEREFMTCLIQNRRKKHFGANQDGKKLSLEQIKTFWTKPNIVEITESLIEKGYLSKNEGLYNPVAGNMSFEVFKFLDPNSISITLVSSDANRIGVVQNSVPRHITPRECARLQGFPDTFKIHADDKWAYHQFGNTVTVPVIKAISEEIITKNLFAL